MDSYKKGNKTYTVGLRPDGKAAIGTVTITDANGNQVGYAEGAAATRLLHSEFNADGTPWTHYDPDRPF